MLAVAYLMVVLDVSIVNVALPSIQKSLDFSTSGLEWVVSAYALTFGGFLLLGGRSGDLLGRRRVFMAGLVLFSFFSLLSGLAVSAEMLIATRALQGAAGAILSPSVFDRVGHLPEGLNAQGARDDDRRQRGRHRRAARRVPTGSWAGGFCQHSVGLSVLLIVPRSCARVARRSRSHFDVAGAVTVTGG